MHYRYFDHLPLHSYSQTFLQYETYIEKFNPCNFSVSNIKTSTFLFLKPTDDSNNHNTRWHIKVMPSDAVNDHFFGIF